MFVLSFGFVSDPRLLYCPRTTYSRYMNIKYNSKKVRLSSGSLLLNLSLRSYGCNRAQDDDFYLLLKYYHLFLTLLQLNYHVQTSPIPIPLAATCDKSPMIQDIFCLLFMCTPTSQTLDSSASFCSIAAISFCRSN